MFLVSGGQWWSGIYFQKLGWLGCGRARTRTMRGWSLWPHSTCTWAAARSASCCPSAGCCRWAPTCPHDTADFQANPCGITLSPCRLLEVGGPHAPRVCALSVPWRTLAVCCCLLDPAHEHGNASSLWHMLLIAYLLPVGAPTHCMFRLGSCVRAAHRPCNMLSSVRHGTQQCKTPRSHGCV